METLIETYIRATLYCLNHNVAWDLERALFANILSATGYDCPPGVSLPQGDPVGEETESLSELSPYFSEESSTEPGSQEPKEFLGSEESSTEGVE